MVGLCQLLNIFFHLLLQIKKTFVYLYNRQSENINNPSLLYLAVSIERDLFFIVMNDLLSNTVLPIALIFLAVLFTILIGCFVFIIVRDLFND